MPDLYSLGTVLFFLASAVDPTLAPHWPAERLDAARREDLVRRVAWRDLLTRTLAPVIFGLVAPDPVRRWDLAKVRGALAAADRTTPQGRARRWRARVASPGRGCGAC